MAVLGQSLFPKFIFLLILAALATDCCFGASISTDSNIAKRQAAFATSTVIHSMEHETAQGVVRSSVFSQFATHPIHALLFQQQRQPQLQKQEEPQAGIVVPTPAAPAPPATTPAPAAPSVASAPPAYLPPWATSGTSSSGGQVHYVQGPFNILVPPPLPHVTPVAGAYLPPRAHAPAYLPPSAQTPEPAPAYLPPTTPAYSPPPPPPAYLAPVTPVTRVIQTTEAPKPAEQPKKDLRPTSVFAVPPPLADLKDWRAPSRKQVRSRAGFSGDLLKPAASSQVFNVGGASNELTAQLRSAAYASSEVEQEEQVEVEEVEELILNQGDLAGGAATEAPPTALFGASVGLEQRLAAIRALRDSSPGGAEGVLDSRFPVQYFQSG